MDVREVVIQIDVRHVQLVHRCLVGRERLLAGASVVVVVPPFFLSWRVFLAQLSEVLFEALLCLLLQLVPPLGQIFFFFELLFNLLGCFLEVDVYDHIQRSFESGWDVVD